MLIRGRESRSLPIFFLLLGKVPIFPYYKMNKISIIVVLSVFFINNLCESSETVDTALQFAMGQVRVIAYDTGFEINSNFRVVSQEKIRVNTNSGSVEYLSNVTREIETRNYGGKKIVKLVINPLDELYWWLKFGAVNLNLEIYPNKLSGSNYGTEAGIGMKYQVFPETIVSPGICFLAGVTVQEIKFDKLYTGTLSGINSKYQTVDTNLSVIISKFITKKIEPYCGFNVFRYQNRLFDENGMYDIEGYKDNISITVGIKYKIYPLEWLVLETQFAGETNVSIGFGWGY